jgi:N-methylhydantoinase A/oxoprolinase/acetone carboxylase beta subunit
VDVGGTFTHAVALGASGLELLAEARVPTTHQAKEGVAAGILTSLEQLLSRGKLRPEQVKRVAHSTTQATNALLEGDVAAVGILCVGEGWEGRRAAGESDLEPLELTAGRFLCTQHRYLELVQGDLDEAACLRAFQEMCSGGAQALVVVSPFSVDDPSLEQRLLKLARPLRIPATATHEISGLYGLRLRTRTAVVNASLLPRMLEVAEHTESAVRALGIEAPLVVMRSDGGAMELSAMRTRPLFTMLSGPAAGLAAALLWARIADGIFLEVGGTSSDVSCIKNGRPFFRAARIGSHRLYLETLDVRTLGVAGGSMARLGAGGEVTRMGPRSAHIAGLGYACFDPGKPKEQLLRIAPRPGDAEDHLALGTLDQPVRTLTPSGAVRFLGKVEGASQGLIDAFETAGEALGKGGKALAEEILRIGVVPLQACVQEVAAECQLDPRRLRLVGGGGGAEVWTPEVAAALGVEWDIAPQAPVISAIGAALALLQETVERTLLDPTPEDFRAIRQAAEARLLAGGAAPESIEVRVEVESQRGILRAVALGSHEVSGDRQVLDEEAILERGRTLFDPDCGVPEVRARLPGLWVLGATRVEARFFGLFKRKRHPWRVLDGRGRVRLGASHGEILLLQGASMVDETRRALERLTHYGDAGGVLPPCFLLAGGRSLDLSGLPQLEARLALVEVEAERVSADEVVALLMNLEVL